MNVNDTNLYIVYWPDTETFKVGVTSRTERVRAYLQTGALLIHSIEHATTVQERSAHAYVASAFDQAFVARIQSSAILGDQGNGWTECYSVPRRHLPGALELALLGVRRGHANETH